MEAHGHNKIYIHFQSQSEINFRMAEGCHLKKPVLKLKMNMAESCHSNNAMRALDSSLVPRVRAIRGHFSSIVYVYKKWQKNWMKHCGKTMVILKKQWEIM